MKSAKNEELYPELPKVVTAIPDEAEQQAKIEAAGPLEAEPVVVEAAQASEAKDVVEEELPKDEVRLSKPIEVNGAQVSVLKISLDRLTTAALTKAERMFQLKAPDFPEDKNLFGSITFWTIVGALAAGVPYNIVEKMPMVDGLELAGTAKTVFFGQ